MSRAQTTATAKPSRVSQSAGLDLAVSGGIGYWPGSAGTRPARERLLTAEGVKWLALRNPLELLYLLGDLHPELSKAERDYQTLGGRRGALDFKAMTTPADGDGEEASDGNALIDAFFRGLPKEVGGREGLISELLGELLFGGNSAGEFVPRAGPNGTGEFWTLPWLTIRPLPEPDGSVALWQRQGQYSVTPTGQVATLGGSNLVKLPMDRIFWRPYGKRAGQIQGKSLFAPALNEILICLGVMRDLALAWHRNAYPTVDVGIDRNNNLKFAQENPQVCGNLNPAEWEMQQFLQAVERYATKEIDAAYFHGTGDAVNALAFNWPDVPGVWGVFQKRLTIAIKHLGILFGNVEGETETWGTVQERFWASGVESVLRAAVEPLRQALESLLQDAGKPYAVEVEYQELKPNHRKDEAEAIGQEILNEIALWRNGFQTQDEASEHLTGTAAVKKMDEPPAPIPAPGGPGAPGSGGRGSGGSQGSGNQNAPRNAVERRLAYYALCQERRLAFERNGHLEEIET